MKVDGANEDRFDFLLLAQDRGLGKALEDFPQDVAAAARIAERVRGDLFGLDDVTTEPWPPMQVRGMV